MAKMVIAEHNGSMYQHCSTALSAYKFTSAKRSKNPTKRHTERNDYNNIKNQSKNVCTISTYAFELHELRWMAQGKSRRIIDPWRPVRCLSTLTPYAYHFYFLYLTENRVLIAVHALMYTVLMQNEKQQLQWQQQRIHVTISLARPGVRFHFCFCSFFFRLLNKIYIHILFLSILSTFQ